MGVPKFYRWLSERYPCISEVLQPQRISEFDYLYLDMNGIIHVCSHPDDATLHRISDKQIYTNIFHYIDVVFRLIQPKKVFMLAIDGVAPRAKMNQQRSRRFRTAKEAADKLAEAVRKGESLPDKDPFDSNCITPGTNFMCNLQAQLEYFVNYKVSTDPTWQRVKVILSGHQVPGEGEHKIMDYIRYVKSTPDHEPDDRHCIYGLDADLIMLGLSTHLRYMSILREEVKFGKPTRQRSIPKPEKLTFQLLHLSLLREYIDHEFCCLRNRLTDFSYDLDCIIDDWILLTFLIGNDFIPNLPTLHTDKGALSDLFNIYKRILPQLGGYINDMGELCQSRFQKLLIAARDNIERPEFDIIAAEAQFLTEKRSSGPKGGGRRRRRRGLGEMRLRPLDGVDDVDTDFDEFKPMEDFFGRNEDLEFSANYDPGLERLLRQTEAELDEDVGCSDEASSDGDTTSPDNDIADENDVRPLLIREENVTKKSAVADVNVDDIDDAEFTAHRHRYYNEKLGITTFDAARRTEQVHAYVSAIKWVLAYYYHGCQSWAWFYPFHYAPWISDLVPADDDVGSGSRLTENIYVANVNVIFEMGVPFKPYEQLLAVLPPASARLLPECYRKLMTEAASPIADFYPTTFACDLNGKKHPWEAVVLIPMIDEDRLLRSMSSIPIASADANRNVEAPNLIYSLAADGVHFGTYYNPQPDMFPLIKANRAACDRIWRSDWLVEKSRLVSVLADANKAARQAANASLPKRGHFVGFPLLSDIRHTAKLRDDGSVRVFDNAPPRSQVHMILTLVNLCRCAKCLSTDKSTIESLPPRLCMMSDLLTRSHSSDVAVRDKVSTSLIGRRVMADWPYMKECQVTRIITADAVYAFKGGDAVLDTLTASTPKAAKRIQVHELSSGSSEADNFAAVRRSIVHQYRTKRGVDIGSVDVLVEVRPVSSRHLTLFDPDTGRYAPNVKNQYSSTRKMCALQTISLGVTRQDELDLMLPFINTADIYRPGMHVVYIGRQVDRNVPSYGAVGIVSRASSGDEGVRVDFVTNDPINQVDVSRLVAEYGELSGAYISAKLASECFVRGGGMTSHLFSRITGSVFVDKVGRGGGGRGTEQRRQRPVNIGLCMKSNKNGTRVRGYTWQKPQQSVSTASATKGPKHSATWFYSSDAVLAVGRYVEKWPAVFSALTRYRDRDQLRSDDIFDDVDDGEDGQSGADVQLDALLTWLATLECRDMSRIESVKAPHAITPALVQQAQRVLDATPHTVRQKSTQSTVTLTMEPGHLLVPNLASYFNATVSIEPSLADGGGAFNLALFDTVVNVNGESCFVPLGAIGLVVGLPLPGAGVEVCMEKTLGLPICRNLDPQDVVDVLWQRQSQVDEQNRLEFVSETDNDNEPRVRRVPVSDLLNVSWRHRNFPLPTTKVKAEDKPIRHHCHGDVTNKLPVTTAGSIVTHVFHPTRRQTDAKVGVNGVIFTPLASQPTPTQPPPSLPAIPHLTAVAELPDAAALPPPCAEWTSVNVAQLLNQPPPVPSIPLNVLSFPPPPTLLPPPPPPSFFRRADEMPNFSVPPPTTNMAVPDPPADVLAIEAALNDLLNLTPR